MGAEEIAWETASEAVRGFLMEKHLPWDQVDPWADEIEDIYREALSGPIVSGVAAPDAGTPIGPERTA